MAKKFLDLSNLSSFLDNLKETFSSLVHKHSISDLTDYTVDSSFSATSTNPVENRVINNALVTIANEMDTLESNISKLNDEKADASDIPTKISELTNDSGFITSSTVNTSISTHNVATDSHNDIRLLISALTTQVNNFLDVDDTTKDQLSELIALIEENADDIESITSGKVNVSDIVNDLTTNVGDKPLSAAQGVAIKTLIDELQGALDADEANLSAHIDNMDMHVSSIERTNWNDAYNKKHEHNNASILEATTASYTIADQVKLSGIENGANKTIVDMTLSLDSDNPIANRAVQEALNNKVSQADFDIHEDDTTSHITSAERTLWNTVTNKAETSVLSDHINDTDNPHNVNEKITTAIEENSDLVTTEDTSNEVEGDAPEINPVVENRIVNVETNISEVKTKVNNITAESLGAATKKYVDEQISLIESTGGTGGSGASKLVMFTRSCVAETEGQTVFNIDVSTFDAENDSVLVQSGLTMLFPDVDFTVSNNTIVLKEGVPVGRTIGIYVLKNVPAGSGDIPGGTVVATKLNMHPISVVSTEDNQTVFNIDLDGFDANNDVVLVQSERLMLAPEIDFNVVGNTVVLTEGVPADRTITIYVFKSEAAGGSGNAGGGKLESYQFTIEAETEGQTEFTIPLNTFDANNDTLMVIDGQSVLLPNVGYTVSGNTITMTEPWSLGDGGGIIVLKTVAGSGEGGSVDIENLPDGSIPLSKLAEMPSVEQIGAMRSETLLLDGISIAEYLDSNNNDSGVSSGVVAYCNSSDAPNDMPSGFLLYAKNYGLTAGYHLVAFFNGVMKTGYYYKGSPVYWCTNNNMDLLWQNASVGSGFEAQTISLDLSKYRKVGIIFSFDQGGAWLSGLYEFEKISRGQREGEIFDQMGVSRKITQIDDTKVVFGAGIMTTFSNGEYINNKNSMVPYQIYGIK